MREWTKRSDNELNNNNNNEKSQRPGERAQKRKRDILYTPNVREK